ncbi:unnamed protein product, partial [Pleuronectes platessa]
TRYIPHPDICPYHSSLRDLLPSSSPHLTLLTPSLILHAPVPAFPSPDIVHHHTATDLSVPPPCTRQISPRCFFSESPPHPYGSSIPPPGNGQNITHPPP